MSVASIPESTERKPAYAIPSMAEIRAVPDSGLRVVSTFSGCGGSCLGFRWAGYRTLWASEFVPDARESYAANWPDVPLDPRDIRGVRGDEIMRRAGLDECDVLEGSPPCASFSVSGRLDEHWGQVRDYSTRKGGQRVDDLFDEYARLVAEIEPRAFVAENVAGLVRGRAKGHFKRIHATLARAAGGYVVSAFKLDAQWLGVPQLRSRVIFVGLRRDVFERSRANVPHDLAPVYLPYRYSIADALPGLGGPPLRDPCPPPHDEPDALYLTPVLQEAFETLAEGENHRQFFNLIRTHRDRPSGSVVAANQARGASVMHPTEGRRFSAAETRRLCGFPDDFALTGNYGKQWERLARAVPPPMMRAVALRLRRVLERAG